MADAELALNTRPSRRAPCGAERLDPDRLAGEFSRVRAVTVALTEPLEPEDQCIQTCPEVSPTKWHLAHTTWFFETMILADAPGFTPFRPGWDFLFNSYYQSVGAMHARPERGLLSRPTVREILEYRAAIDEQIVGLLERGASSAQRGLIELGLHHEQQHQELICTDIKHVLAANPLAPRYREPTRTGDQPRGDAPTLRWVEDPGGLVEVGRDLAREDAAFGFDNEGPRHKQWLEPFAVASRPATCGEYLAFIADGGYARPELWLAEGWDTVLRDGWRAPDYWRPIAGDGLSGDAADWRLFTLRGLVELDPGAPVCHLSYYEADAFARWRGARLPSEAEWERIADAAAIAGNLLPEDPSTLADAAFHPTPAGEPNDAVSGMRQLFGDVWEWTRSPYAPFPGYRPPPGAISEYNGKFMCNQMVLRGGSCATPVDHVRASYRNFFHAHARWQFSGVRLARDLG